MLQEIQLFQFSPGGIHKRDTVCLRCATLAAYFLVFAVAVSPAATTTTTAVFRTSSGDIAISEYEYQSVTTAGGGMLNAPAAAQAPNGDTYVVVLDGSTGLWGNIFSAATRRWQGWQYSCGSGLIGTPAIVVASDGTGHVAVRSSYNAMWVVQFRPGTTHACGQPPTSQGFSAWTPLGGVLAIDPKVAISGGRVHVFSRDGLGSAAGGFWVVSFPLDSPSLYAWAFTGGVGKNGSIVSVNSDAVFLVVRDAGDGVWVGSEVWNGSGHTIAWHGQDGVLATGPSAAVTTADNTLSIAGVAAAGVVWLGEFNTVTRTWVGWKDTQWDHSLRSMTGVSSAMIGPDAAIAGRDSNGTLWWYKDGAGWASHNDPTNGGVPVATPGTSTPGNDLCNGSPCPARTITRGGSNYTNYKGCGTQMSPITHYNLNAKVPNTPTPGDKIRAQLQQMRANKQESIRLFIWHSKGFGTTCPSGEDDENRTEIIDSFYGNGGDASPECKANLKNLLTYIVQVGFKKVSIVFGPQEDSDPSRWPVNWDVNEDRDWNIANLFDPNWHFIARITEDVLDTVPGLDYQIDLNNEAGVYLNNPWYPSSPLIPYMRSLYYNFTFRYGSARTVGFSFFYQCPDGQPPDQCPPLTTLLARLKNDVFGNSPPPAVLEFHAKRGTDLTLLHSAMQAENMTQSLIIGEAGAYNDDAVASSLASVQISRPIRYLMQWPESQRPNEQGCPIGETVVPIKYSRYFWRGW